jgi:hypothetical protein
METIYKYPVEPTMVIRLPKDAKPLCVQMQNGAPYMWVVLDNEAKTDDRIFHCTGTGHDMSRYSTSRLDYIGTFQGEGLVFHVFEQVFDPQPKEGE